ncbi:MAG: lysophospholipid acyltransferase family protein [Opitutaceae bacterium]
MSKSSTTPKQLKKHERFLLWIVVLLVRVWSRTFRFHWGSDMQALMDSPPKPSIIIVWHNRLFAAPEFFRRHFRKRKLATIISASSDGGWLAGFFETLGILPVRGSRYGRGAQAFRELIAANEAGYDVGVTPDGSRGPMYDMKPGAVAVAMKTGAPIVLLSFNMTSAWRLKSWDKFYIPVPFSRIEVKAVHFEGASTLQSADSKVAAEQLKAEMDAITEDDTYFGNT